MPLLKSWNNMKNCNSLGKGLDKHLRVTALVLHWFKNSSNWPVTSQPNPWDTTNQIDTSFPIAMHMHYSCQTHLITAQQQWDVAKGQTQRATCFWTFKEALMKVCWVYRCRLNSRGFQKGNLLNCPVFQPVHVTPGQQHYLFSQSVPVSLFSTVPFLNRLKKRSFRSSLSIPFCSSFNRCYYHFEQIA